MKAVVIVGALDTKGRELAFVKDLVEQQGLAALFVDFGILGEPTIPADVGREEVARAGGGDLEYLRRNKLREEAMPIMAEGLAVVVWGCTTRAGWMRSWAWAAVPGAYGRFDGREGDLSVDGEVATATPAPVMRRGADVRCARVRAHGRCDDGAGRCRASLPRAAATR